MCDERDLNLMSAQQLFGLLLEKYNEMEALTIRQCTELAKSPNAVLKNENSILRDKNQWLTKRNGELNEFVTETNEENRRLKLRLALLENPRETPTVYVTNP